MLRTLDLSKIFFSIITLKSRFATNFSAVFAAFSFVKYIIIIIKPIQYYFAHTKICNIYIRPNILTL